MARLRLFASAREVAGTGHDEIPGSTVADVLHGACERYGPSFERLLVACQVWLDGEPCELTDPVGESGEVAVLPPVSGG